MRTFVVQKDHCPAGDWADTRIEDVASGLGTLEQAIMEAVTVPVPEGGCVRVVEMTEPGRPVFIWWRNFGADSQCWRRRGLGPPPSC